MSSPSDALCQHGDTLCEIRVYEQEVIVVPTLLLASFLVTLVFILLLRFCPERVDRIRPQAIKAGDRRTLHGIDAPPGINVLEHESIALEMSNTYSTFHPPTDYASKKFPLPSAAVASPGPLLTPSFTPVVQPRELPSQRLPESFNLVTPLNTTFSLRSDDAVSLHRARMENRNVVLRVLKDSTDVVEKHNFLGFARFLAQLGPHPFLPELLGVVSLRAPLVTVVEELENRDLLSFLWRCRQKPSEPACEMTERRIFTMAKHVASALEFLHAKGLIHGNVRARNVLVSGELTAKLWGLHGVYTRKEGGGGDDASRKKWMAPEILARQAGGPSSDIWSFGVLLYEMATLGDAPYAEIPVNELLQFHQRGKSLKKPPACSAALHALIKACCQWKDQDRPTMVKLGQKLMAGEKGASDRVLTAPEPISIERYLKEAGYGDNNSYTVF